jgi:uncharacterized protein YbjT (DUF2867 family)
VNVLVTGGTGFVGREIVRQLRVTGHRIHLLARHPDSRTTRELAEQCGCKVRPGNVLDATSLRGVCAGIDGVIHLVGIISEFGGQTFENVHVRGTQNIVFAAQDGNVLRFIQMSALGTRPEAPARYHQTKWAAEERARRSGLGWTVFRPSIIYGPGDRFVNLFAKLARLSPVMPVMGRGESKLQPVSVKVVAAAFVKSLTDSAAVGEIYDLCGPDILTLNQVMDQILEVTGRTRPKLHLPLALARSQASFAEFIFPRLFRRAPPLNRDQLRMLEEDNVGNGEPANQRFGLKHRPFREGIAEYLK